MEWPFIQIVSKSSSKLDPFRFAKTYPNIKKEAYPNMKKEAYYNTDALFDKISHSLTIRSKCLILYRLDDKRNANMNRSI